jgi:hypothetical protein
MRDGVTSAERDRVKALEREVRELRKANEILKLASAFFAQAENGLYKVELIHRRAPWKTKRRWTWPPRNGYRGLTINVCSNPSVIFHRLRPRKIIIDSMPSVHLDDSARAVRKVVAQLNWQGSLRRAITLP